MDALLESPIDARRALAGNIIISGGLGRLPGLGRRLLQEIKQQTSEEKYTKLENLDVRNLCLKYRNHSYSVLKKALY